MVKYCCAPHCKNKDGDKFRSGKLSFHCFPSRPELRRLWTVAVKRYDPVTKTLWQPGKHACLCSEHFSPEDFRYNRGYRLLREGAIPTQFNYMTTKLQKIVVPCKNTVSRVASESAESSVVSSKLDDKAENKFGDVSRTTNYSQWLLENLFSLYTQDIFCDTVLIVGEQQLKAHSVVLSASSPFFHSALKIHSRPGLRYLTLPDFDFDVLEIAMRFIYTGNFEAGKKYAQSKQRADLLNSLRKLGLNLEHLEACEINHHSDAEETVCSSVKVSTDSAEVQDRAESSFDEEQSSSTVSCGRDAKLAVPIRSQNSLKQSSLVSSSLNIDEIIKEKVEHAGCNVILAPVEGRSSSVQTPVDGTSVLSEVTNGWVLQSGTGLHIVKVPQELLAEIELENKKIVLDQTGGKAPLDSLKKPFHSRAAKKACTKKRDVATVRRRHRLMKNRPGCSESAVDLVHDDFSIAQQRQSPPKKPNYVCSTCGKEFLGIFRYNVHLRVHTGEKPYSCKSCGKKFAIMTNLNRHLRSHTGDRRYLCDLCGHAFIQKSTLEDHVNSIHTKEKKHMCTFCGKFFTSLGCYRAHSKRHELRGSIKYRCEYGKLSESMRLMCQKAESTVSVDGTSRFVCKICRKDYASKSILAIHLKRHSIAKPFVCCFCKKSYWQRSHLEIHERLHTGETPFTCSMCSKGFSSRGKLSVHEMLHNDRTPYKCVSCGSSFSLPAYLKAHMRMHTDDRPHECKVCGKKYRKKINLQFHLNRTHDQNKLS